MDEPFVKNLDKESDRQSDWEINKYNLKINDKKGSFEIVPKNNENPSFPGQEKYNKSDKFPKYQDNK